MTATTSISWTDATWNPIGGCTRVHSGCTNCYAGIMAARFSDPGQWGHGLAHRIKAADGTTQYRWTGNVQLNEKALTLPLRWRKPRHIFVNSTSDLFHEKMPDDWIDKVFAVMALAPQHTFQVLTKRPERAQDYLVSLYAGQRRVADSAIEIRGSIAAAIVTKDALAAGYPNVWLGTSISTQADADAMIPPLLAAPAAVRFVSAEPLLGPVDLGVGLPGEYDDDLTPGLDWVIVGGESGRNARPMHPDWARSIRDQCVAAGVPFHFKQWGEWSPCFLEADDNGEPSAAYPMDGCSDPLKHDRNQPVRFWMPNGSLGFWTDVESLPATGARKVGTKAAGRTLDWQTWDQMPGVGE